MLIRSISLISFIFYFFNRYQRTGNTNKTNDIYSFGIILFVLIIGRQAIVRAAGENIHILQWVIPIIEGGDIQKLFDPKLEGKFSINSARKVVEIAMSCISPNAAHEPNTGRTEGMSIFGDSSEK